MPSFTQKAIMQAFQELLEVTPFDKITVSAVAQRCGIHHNTFYYHYKDIYDLLELWLRDVLGQYAEEEIDGDWTNNVKYFLQSCREHKPVVYHIFNSLSRDQLERFVFTLTDDVFLRYVHQQAEGLAVPPEKLTDISKVCRYAIFGYFLEFLWDNMNDDTDAAVEKLSGLFTGFVRSALRDAANG